MQNRYSMQDIERTAYLMEDNMNANIVYPEIYYKVQPFVMCACDQMELYGNQMNQKMLDQVSENIYSNVCMMHPDMVEYANQPEMKLSVESTQRDADYFPRDRDYSSRYNRFRRRGILRDFVDILLINELFRRGRWIF